MKNQHRIKKLTVPFSIGKAASKNYVDKIFKNDIEFKDVNLENIKFVKVKYQPAVIEDLTPKIYVDDAIDQATLLRNNQDNDFKNYN